MESILAYHPLYLVSCCRQAVESDAGRERRREDSKAFPREGRLLLLAMIIVACCAQSSTRREIHPAWEVCNLEEVDFRRQMLFFKIARLLCRLWPPVFVAPKHGSVCTAKGEILAVQRTAPLGKREPKRARPGTDCARSTLDPRSRGSPRAILWSFSAVCMWYWRRSRRLCIEWYRVPKSCRRYELLGWRSPSLHRTETSKFNWKHNVKPHVQCTPGAGSVVRYDAAVSRC
jgi:hypothetical protein